MCAEPGPAACKFLKAYRNQLAHLDLDAILKELENLANSIQQQE